MGRTKKKAKLSPEGDHYSTVANAGASRAQEELRAMDISTSDVNPHATDVKFENLPLMPQTKRALSLKGYTYCTTVQAAALPVMLSGVDLLCKARTGTGKTLAFLIPAVEQLAKRQAPKRPAIYIMVISPTRELAFQIEKEAKELAQAHKLGTQCVVGGTNASTDASKLNRQTPAILVGTPGRLIDLMQTTQLADKLQGLQTLIFDEADRLLDMGFKPSIDKILGMLEPVSSRQNVMFSATYPEDIQKLCKNAMRPGYEIVDTVGESAIQTAEKIHQAAVVSSMADQMANLLHILQAHQKTEPDYKVMVFFTTARLTGLYAEIFTRLGLPVLEMHSRLSQSKRTKIAEQFRKQSKLMLFSSDVSARGVDYPATTLVVQVGLPTNREQYIHRVGRTARAGAQGQAILLLQDFESRFLNQIKDLPVQSSPCLSRQAVEQCQPRIDNAINGVDESSRGQAYQAWLGFYKTFVKTLRWDTAQLVSQANAFAMDVLGCPEPPALEKKIIGKMGLKGVPGLRVGGPSISQAKKGGTGGRGRPGSPNDSNLQAAASNHVQRPQQGFQRQQRDVPRDRRPRQDAAADRGFGKNQRQPQNAKRVYQDVDW